MKIINFLRNWTLIIAILAGVFGYFIYVNIPFLDGTHEFAYNAIKITQPILIFSMLFLTFCKVNPKRLRFCRWHLWLLLFQALSFSLLAGLFLLLPLGNHGVLIEGAMICLICPTATAGAVITKKLGGNVTHITTYTILINLVTAILIPAFVPLIHPESSMSLFTSATLILGKVFPLLLFPLLLAFLVRYLFPKLHLLFYRNQEVAFYLWAVALALAMAITTRSIVHTKVPISTQLWLVVVSLVCCVLQFYLGRKVGFNYHDKVAAGQSLGQKNTVLAIWMGYTFFSPITSLVGGFYSIWHNVINTMQLYEYRKKKEKG
ncbi:BASS family bile acid:Na+ symporter [Balneicella halophila]|uniref:BASS family bile acid:Na+ symporter n=1 Tax=Balneicella halophila TaxID=1537566 RepID=A0A7L4UQB7_BALHA|nr:transporter [Balneicella halophila]PVX51006.1 BASS family bile acid:Na+ symporter [Balneicella halophila]